LQGDIQTYRDVLPTFLQTMTDLLVAIGENIAPRSQFVEGSMSDYIGMPTNMGIKTTQQIQTDSTATSKRHDHEVVISLKGFRYTRDIA
jgi:hypothetical protein